MLKRLFNTAIFCMLAATADAQEFNCKVTVMHIKITGKDEVVFTNMQKSLNDFMNTHKWTTDEYATNEKIDCNILINLTGGNVNGDPDTYTATMSIQATRPVYNASYTSTIINYIDKDVVFKYTQFNPIRFDDNQVGGSDPMTGNLTALLAYYSYITLALDYDSFSPLGGTALLKRAQNVVTNAPETKGITGWKAVENTYNRYWLVDQMLNTRFDELRKYWYTMHREGLDSMYLKPVESRGRILGNIRRIFQVNKENPNSVYVQFFFNAKNGEIVHLLELTPKNERMQYITLLSTMDVPNLSKYNALK